MASFLKRTNRLQSRDLIKIFGNLSIRHGHVTRGKPPGIARTLEQRLKDDFPTTPVRRTDIGFPRPRPSRSAELKARLAHLKKQRQDVELEKLARAHKLLIDLDQCKSDWQANNAPHHIKRLADHYSVYDHLFGGTAYFMPRVILDIKFETPDGETFSPVFYGNLLKPSETQQAPLVSYDSSYSLKNEDPKKTLWTLVMTNPDGHFEHEDKEYLHWMVANIPGNDIAKGEVIAPYLQPFPPKGTGFHRHIFILYKQDKKIDLSAYRIEKPFDLPARTFTTSDFYLKHQANLTPAGLAFFQADWDKTLTDFYHQKLDMKEPFFEYDFPEQYVKIQEYFPLKQPFNLYMDRYMDPKKVAKRYIEKKLAKTHPFDGPEPPLRFPMAHSYKNIPSWLATQLRNERRGWGRILDFKD